MYRLSEMAVALGGDVIQDGGFEMLEYCTSDCKASFLTFLENPKYADCMNGNAVCIVTTDDNVERLPVGVQGILIAKEPKKWFVTCHNYLANDAGYAGEDVATVIGADCNISPLAHIAKKNVRIGDHVTIGAFTVIRERVEIGNCVAIHENCVIGGKSFNYVKASSGEMLPMADLGRVVIEDDVEICPMCHIAGAPLPTDVTHLKRGSKLDAMVHVGHGTTIGERTEIPAGAQIAGNCRIGDDAWIGVNATIANRITIGDKGRVSLGAVVTKDVADGETVTGNFAVEHGRFISELKESNLRAERKSGGYFPEVKAENCVQRRRRDVGFLCA